MLSLVHLRAQNHYIVLTSRHDVHVSFSHISPGGSAVEAVRDAEGGNETVRKSCGLVGEPCRVYCRGFVCLYSKVSSRKK